MSSRVLLTQAVTGDGVAKLACACRLETLGEALTAESARERDLTGIHGLVCMLTDRVDRALLDLMPSLQFVSSISVGVDHVDVQALTERGIPLGHTPGVLVDATADTAFALLMAAALGSLAGLLMMGRAWRGDALVLIALVASARSPDAEILALRAATVILLIRLAAGSTDRSAP